MTQLDRLKQESRSLNQLKRAHERLQGHQAQVSRANAELESLSSNKNTRSKLQHADVSAIEHLVSISTCTYMNNLTCDSAYSACMIPSHVLESIRVNNGNEGDQCPTLTLMFDFPIQTISRMKFQLMIIWM